jgi:hypothetical protein
MASEVDEQVKGAVIGIVEILEDQQDWLPTRDIPHEHGDSLQQSPSIILGITWSSQLALQPPANVGNDARHFGCSRAKLSLERLRLRRLDVRHRHNPRRRHSAGEPDGAALPTRPVPQARTFDLQV